MPNEEIDQEIEEEELEEDVEETEDREDAELQEEESEEIPITYMSENGVEVTENIPYDKLVEIVANSKKPSKDAEYMKAVQPLVKAVNESQVLQDYFRYKQQGYSDEQIIKGLYINATKGREDEEVDDDTKKTQKEIEVLNKKVDSFITKEESEKYKNHNAALLETAAAKYGKDIPDDVVMEKVTATFRIIYPNLDLTKYPLTQEQVSIIMKEALSGVKVQKIASNMSKQASIPKVLGGRSITKTEKPKSNVLYGTTESREKAFNDLIK